MQPHRPRSHLLRLPHGRFRDPELTTRHREDRTPPPADPPARAGISVEQKGTQRAVRPMTSQEDITFDLRTTRGQRPTLLGSIGGCPTGLHTRFPKRLGDVDEYARPQFRCQGVVWRRPPIPSPRPASGVVVLAPDRLREDGTAMEEALRPRTQRSRQPCQTEVGHRFRFTVTGATRHRRRRCTQ